MIEIYDNLLTNEDSEELIRYYNDNITTEFTNFNEVYSFKAVNLVNYENLGFHKKIQIYDPLFIRVQLVDQTVPLVEKMHVHIYNWTFVAFLNDDYVGGELIIDNITIKPKKNSLVVFTGNLRHRVTKTEQGKRFTLVSFSDFKPTIKTHII
jgi:hypothetical protein